MFWVFETPRFVKKRFRSSQVQTMAARLLKFFFIILAELSTGEFSSCIPKEYRGVRREVWRGISGGWYLKHLTSDSRFPNSPTTVEVLQELSSPRNEDDFYGQRLQAYFIAPSSGNYTFYATCDSECVFYLGFDEKPENKKELIRIDQDHRTGYDQWNRYLLQRSCLQELEKGKLYFIEALHTNYIKNDHMRIHVQFPGFNTSSSLDHKNLFLYTPGSSVQTTCVLLRRCGVTCGGGQQTRIMTRDKLVSGACVNETGNHKEETTLYVEAYNITTSEAVIAWKLLQTNASELIPVSGYTVNVKSKQDKGQEKTVNTSVHLVAFENLKTFTNYCVTVEPLTVLKGLGRDICYYFTTDDDIPDLPPQNITVESRGSVLHLKWKPVPEQNRNGVILGYKLIIKLTSATYHQQKPNDEDTGHLSRFATVLEANVFFFELRNVEAFTWYCFKMLAFTRRGEGPLSSCAFILTEEAVPSLPPMNVSTTPLNATFFSVTWEPVPPGHNHGIILGYKVLLENMEDTSLVLTAIVNVNQTWIMLNESSKSAPILCARVVAFTSKGDGQSSTCNEVWTWSEETMFPKMTAVSHYSPTGIRVKWNKLRTLVLRQLTHYNVTYEEVSEAGYPVLNSSSTTVNVRADSRKLTLSGLKTYTTYKIRVEPVTFDAKMHNNKIMFAETCRCPQVMFANWYPKPPYIIKENATAKPRGIIPEILVHMLQVSCGQCLAYQTWNISYNFNKTENILDRDNQPWVDFRFPVRSAVGRTTYRGIHKYIPLLTIPGVALMTRKKTPSGYARDLSNSVLACWPIFAVSFSMAILTGILIWFVEYNSNSQHFFNHFHQGIVEGIWWSLVTMTTVGYGDRYPKTILGRSIAIVWFLAGIVLSSLLVSSLTSSMSVRILDKHLSVATQGRKVGSLAQFPEYEILVRYKSQVGGSNPFPSLERLVDALKQDEVDGILVDVYTAHYRSDLFNVTWIKISQILAYKFTCGVIISGNAAKLERIFREYVGNKSTVVTDILQKTNQENEKVSHTQSRIQKETVPLLDPGTALFNLSLFILFSLLCVAVIIGMLYQLWYSGRQKRRYDIQAIRMRERKEYKRTKQELQSTLEEFYQRFYLTYKQLRLKHRKQLKCLKKTEKSLNNLRNRDVV
ncbi:unnamed protein product [Porites lobata]|uniref:Uncharacterized protein n=1 Tax=Porites lobata TaxID=104759 RepID=A0ABN8RLL2_9CNID|nr:unnamed protein product [Porites lobata]